MYLTSGTYWRLISSDDKPVGISYRFLHIKDHNNLQFLGKTAIYDDKAMTLKLEGNKRFKCNIVESTDRLCIVNLERQEYYLYKKQSFILPSITQTVLIFLFLLQFYSILLEYDIVTLLFTNIRNHSLL